jgi:hypothetical protein
MDDLPGVVFDAECRRYSKIEVGELLASRDLGLPMLRLMDHRKVGRLVPSDAVGALEVTVSEP